MHFSCKEIKQESGLYFSFVSVYVSPPPYESYAAKIKAVRVLFLSGVFFLVGEKDRTHTIVLV